MYGISGIAGVVIDTFTIGSLVYFISALKGEHSSSPSHAELYSIFHCEKMIKQGFVFLAIALLISMLSTSVMAFNAFDGEELLNLSFLTSKIFQALFSIWMLRAVL